MTVLDAITGSLPHRRAEAERFDALLAGHRVDGGPGAHPELAGLAALAAGLAPVEHAPDPSFRLALRERLVTEAADRPVTAPQGVRPESRSTGTTAGDRSQPRWRTAAATLTVAALATGAGAAAASSRALPGDSLYGLKRQIESVELALAHTDLGRGRELLEQADARLGEAEELAASSAVSEQETQQQLGSTLADMAAATTDGAAALLESYRETGDAEPLLLLDRFATEQRERLADLMELLSPGLRARMAPVLDELARLERRASALLGSVTSLAALEVARDSGDGWAVSRVLGTAGGSTGVGSGSGASGLTATAGGLTGGGGSLADGSTGGTGTVSDLLDDATGALTGSGGSGPAPGSGGTGGTGLGSGSTSGTGVEDVVDDVTDTATEVAEPVTSAVPLPTVPTASPLPTSTPLPSVQVSSITSPLPTASACVTLLGVETC